MPTFAARLKAARVARGMTQQALAKAAGLTRNAITMMEQDGPHTTTAPTLFALADALGIDPRELALGKSRSHALRVRETPGSYDPKAITHSDLVRHIEQALQSVRDYVGQHHTELSLRTQAQMVADYLLSAQPPTPGVHIVTASATSRN